MREHPGEHAGAHIAWRVQGQPETLAGQGRAVFVSSHLIGEMALTADQLVVIGRGRLLAQTSVAELAARSTSLEEAFLELTGGAVEYRGSGPTAVPARRHCRC